MGRRRVNYLEQAYYNKEIYPKGRPRKKKNQGCYVATAVYGSYDCPQVWTLRRYRDSVLANTWYGRSFIKVYYTISPTVVRYFGKNTLFQKVIKKHLDKMVIHLNKRGLEDSPYYDDYL